MKLHFETGHPVSRDVGFVEGQEIRVVTPDGHTVFSVTILEHERRGVGLEVRAVDGVRIDGADYYGRLAIHPQFSNSVEITLRKDS